MQAKIRQIPYYSVLALLIYMPFHVFLSQWLSTFTGGLSVWKGAKDALTFGVLLASVALVALYNKKTPKTYWYLVLAGGAYGLLHIILYLVNKDTSASVAGLATAYNCRLFAYSIIGFSAALLTPKQLEPRKIIKIVLIVSTVVCLIGLLQYALPKDVLTHFGYSIARGVKPAFFIDDKPDLPRIMSTLRDPNSLGAFLIVPITLLAYEFFTGLKKRRLLVMGLLGLHGLALLLTFSRSAWLGAFVSAGIVAVYQLRRALKPFLIKNWPLVLGVVLLAGSLTLMFRHQYAVQNILVHSDASTAAKSQHDSNGYHWLYTRRGLEGIANKPLGHGPGTAGIVSIQNPNGGLLTENYYVQIGYEVGILGLLVFIGAHVLIYKELLKRRSGLGLCLLAAFWGYLIVNMLLHIWSNEAVAAQWWLLAGMVLAIPAAKTKKA